MEVVEATKNAMGWPKMPDLILVGHSLGGAVVVEVAKRGNLGKAVQGYAVLDVVEGTADLPESPLNPPYKHTYTPETNVE